MKEQGLRPSSHRLTIHRRLESDSHKNPVKTLRNCGANESQIPPPKKLQHSQSRPSLSPPPAAIPGNGPGRSKLITNGT
ncbi:hypothetical protein E2C01_006222 [Portunus trituberculatus]|uniref:Uncharacterized protein n=1 Tax=Portunus trituberculatus TaxID=210409 RepID=A0A5B7CXK8_PORTR|nr:hypothetical protein [Portunus trituberculatus]